MRSNVPAWGRRLADTVRERRKTIGLTQEELARLAGCGPVFVYSVERGKGSLRLDKLVAVLQVLGLELLIRPRTGNAVLLDSDADRDRNR